jgi:hypothetical protein
MSDQDSGPHPGERQPAAELLPAVYAELRRLAGLLSKQLPPGQTLQPTDLVHKTYLSLVGRRDPGWEGRRDFFGAVARAMREILIAQASARPHTSAAARVYVE